MSESPMSDELSALRSCLTSPCRGIEYGRRAVHRLDEGDHHMGTVGSGIRDGRSRRTRLRPFLFLGESDLLKPTVGRIPIDRPFCPVTMDCQTIATLRRESQ